MICSSEKRFFTSNLLGIGNWTPNRCATQTRGDVERRRRFLRAFKCVMASILDVGRRLSSHDIFLARIFEKGILLQGWLDD
ncbi:hypothetical protein EYR04_22075 [Xanthomonas oryzae pv. oryzae]|nr:hypothetical protein EYR04_22075 [Xanthomonas oryzae pv. oryzae]